MAEPFDLVVIGTGSAAANVAGRCREAGWTSRATISADLNAIRTHWREAMVEEWSFFRETRLEEIRGLKQELYAAWERSKKERSTVRLTPAKNGKGQPAIVTESRYGDPAIIAEIRKLIQVEMILSGQVPAWRRERGEVAATDGTPTGQPIDGEQAESAEPKVLAIRIGPDFKLTEPPNLMLVDGTYARRPQPGGVD
jgi:hypothetical protein